MIKGFFRRGVEEIISEQSLLEKLKADKKLRIKYGVDPTRPDIHLGHTVLLWKLRELQDLGHTIIFLIGDYTAKVGDPSGKNKTRPMLTDEEIKTNAKTYFENVGKILDIGKTEIRYNSEWYKQMDFNDILQLTAKFTVAQILERDDFEKRIKSGNDLGLHEILYPVMQAYDSVMLNADVEFGGSDQKFNMLAGRSLQKKMGQSPQDVVIMQLLVGLDGKNKMSKSLDNYVGITEEPSRQYGKIMSIPDDLIFNYFNLCTNLSDEKIAILERKITDGENPRNVKMKLAKEIVALYHGSEEAEKAEAEFVKIFSKKELPTEMPVIKIRGNYQLLALLVEIGAASSNSEARRLITQGGVKVDSVRISDPNAEVSLSRGMVLQVGKQKFYEIG